MKLSFSASLLRQSSSKSSLHQHHKQQAEQRSPRGPHSSLVFPSPKSSSSMFSAFLVLTLLQQGRLASAATTPSAPSWAELEANLSDGSFQIANVDDWVEQCAHVFKTDEPVGSQGYKDLDDLSNYQLFEQPSGLCSPHLSCAYEKCAGPILENIPFYNSPPFTDEVLKGTSFTYDVPATPGWPISGVTTANYTLNLPEVVVHPEHVGDISETIKFATKHKIGISVKTSGHSYTGSNTKKGTILLQLRNLPRYTIKDGTSIVECEIDEDMSGAYEDACALAIARNKRGVLRVGGGQIWNEVLGAVSVIWNYNGDADIIPDEGNGALRKYHVVSGSSGTVGGAGGWLASGGLAGNNGMRLYGLGIDQVLHVEMVLPSGVHVRFGPTEWTEEPGMLYPRTQVVTGYCNHGDLADEEAWDWQECEDSSINFHDLWYATRGGGGGTYGVVTAIYYQLHEYTKLDYVSITGTIPEDLQFKWTEFLLKFFFDPKSLGISEFSSNSCSAPGSGVLIAGFVTCFNGAGATFKKSWEKYISASADDYLLVQELASWAHGMINVGRSNPNIPDGKAADPPPPTVLPDFTKYNPMGNYMMFPLDIMISKRDELVEMIYDCVYVSGVCDGGMYIQGGVIPYASDGMNALASHRRHGAFLMYVNDFATREAFQRLFLGASDGESVTGNDFPGALCHNHAGVDFPTPLKKDWTKICDPSWSDEEKAEKCFSFHEAAWGTKILKKLESIHSSVDPYRLFDCWDGVGYSKGKKGKKDKKSSKATKKKSKNMEA